LGKQKGTGKERKRGRGRESGGDWERVSPQCWSGESETDFVFVKPVDGEERGGVFVCWKEIEEGKEGSGWAGGVCAPLRRNARGMATGDLRNNVEKLRQELRGTCVDESAVEWAGVAEGNPVALLPILHKVLLDDSHLVARYLANRGYQLFPTNDRKFLEGVFRIARSEFSYKMHLTLDQFLSQGFAERKIIFVCDVIKLCKRLATDLERTRKSSHVRSRPSQSLNDSPSQSRAKSKVLAVKVNGDSNSDESGRNGGSPAFQKNSLGRPKPRVNLQTTGHAIDSLKSPNSSGPVSPVSTMSAASAPAVFRQAPVRAKPDIVLNNKKLQSLISPPLEQSGNWGQESFSYVKRNTSTTSRAMEYWVTSPPPSNERSQQAGARRSNGTSAGRMSPKFYRPRRTTSPGGSVSERSQNSFVASRPRSGVTGSPIDLSRRMLSNQSTPHSVTSSRTGASERYMPSSHIARKLSLPSESEASRSYTGTPKRRTPERTHTGRSSSKSMSRILNGSRRKDSASVKSEAAVLSPEDMSKFVSTLDMLSLIPTRISSMEKNVYSALETMERRIQTLDRRLQIVSNSVDLAEKESEENHQEKKDASCASPFSSKSTTPPPPPPPQAKAESNPTEIDDFLKVIEERFKETATVLAEID